KRRPVSTRSVTFSSFMASPDLEASKRTAWVRNDPRWLVRRLEVRRLVLSAWMASQAFAPAWRGPTARVPGATSLTLAPAFTGMATTGGGGAVVVATAGAPDDDAASRSAAAALSPAGCGPALMI